MKMETITILIIGCFLGMVNSFLALIYFNKYEQLKNLNKNDNNTK